MGCPSPPDQPGGDGSPQPFAAPLRPRMTRRLALAYFSLKRRGDSAAVPLSTSTDRLAALGHDPSPQACFFGIFHCCGGFPKRHAYRPVPRNL